MSKATTAGDLSHLRDRELTDYAHTLSFVKPTGKPGTGRSCSDYSAFAPPAAEHMACTKSGCAFEQCGAPGGLGLFASGTPE